MGQASISGQDTKESSQLEPLSNYLWQLRLYSYADLLLLLMALRANLRQVLGDSFLWFGFLIFCEQQHKDVGRRRWPRLASAIVWLIGLVLLPKRSSLHFLAFAILYSFKKRIKAVGIFSFLINGCIKGCLVGSLPSSDIATVASVTAVMSIRNLAGDVRDAGKDFDEGVVSLPVLLGYRRNTRIVYPATLATTSLLWTILGDLPLWQLVATWMIQLATYHRTPR